MNVRYEGRKQLGIIANTSKSAARELVSGLHEELRCLPVDVFFERQTGALIGLTSTLTSQELAQKVDVLLVLGGDGTILEVVHGLSGDLPAIFGINLGTLGFLTCASASAYREAAENIASGKYVLSERTFLEVCVHRYDEEIHSACALNDAVISRGELSRLIRLDVSIDGSSLTQYNADGLIVATPTGSTAYSLSAGGPVIAPDSGVFVITPICPHVLTNRSVIVADASRIEIRPSQGQDAVFLTLDGRSSVRVEPHDVMTISKSTRRLSLAMSSGISFFEVLRQKLKWSGAAV